MRTDVPEVEIRPLSDEVELPLLQEHMRGGPHTDRAAAHASGAATFLVAWMDGRPVGYLLLKWTGADEAIVHELMRLPRAERHHRHAGASLRGIGTR